MANLDIILMALYTSREGGNLMITVTDKADEVIKDFLKDKNAASAIRITLSIG